MNQSRYVPPVSRAPASELVLQRGGLASEIAFQGGKPRVQNRISKGSCGLRKWKTEKIFSAHNDQGSMKHEQK